MKKNEKNENIFRKSKILFGREAHFPGSESHFEQPFMSNQLTPFKSVIFQERVFCRFIREWPPRALKQ